ncbi:hypothetical protein BFP70_13140 [Thioclava sp. SK-1]|uniref:TetR/AcrR family transcriptional regulator n=1 Tax=Thioclava sp. SK-1 TaxID=1889770 RepID=UPI000824E930|nr:TetR/AcrR family transcriptional regulator [Thioclava sp. SK-1]OCX63148.1 hypothetical protein BFP70_13140 [Thioclava sp. SK-1]
MARPRKENAIDIKGRAMEIAMDMLSTSPDRLSLLELARRIGCSAPALYAYFNGRDDLLEQLRARAYADLIAQYLEKMDDGAQNPLTRLHRAGLAMVDFAEDRPALYRLIFAPEHDIPEPKIDLNASLLAAISHELAALDCTNQTIRGSVHQLARLMWFTVHGAIMCALDRQLIGPANQRWAQARETVVSCVDMLDLRCAVTPTAQKSSHVIPHIAPFQQSGRASA